MSIKTGVMARLFKDQTGEELGRRLSDIFAGYKGEVTDKKWVDDIYSELQQINLHDPEVVYDIATSIHKIEKKKHTSSAPGTNSQLSFDEITPEWAEMNGIALEGSFVKWKDANPEHSLHYLKSRQKNAYDAVSAASRAAELHELVVTHGSIGAAMKARGVAGW